MRLCLSWLPSRCYLLTSVSVADCRAVTSRCLEVPASGPLHLPFPLPRSLYSFFLKSSMFPSPSFSFLLRCYHFLVVRSFSRV